MTAPDYVEPTIGWRTWGLVRDGGVTLLSSPLFGENLAPARGLRCDLLPETSCS